LCGLGQTRQKHVEAFTRRAVHSCLYHILIKYSDVIGETVARIAGGEERFTTSLSTTISNSHLLPVVKEPSGMKKAPTVTATTAANLKNQNLEAGKRRD